MAVPKYNDFYKIFLEFVGDGEIHGIKDFREHVKREMNLTESDLAE